MRKVFTEEELNSIDNLTVARLMISSLQEQLVTMESKMDEILEQMALLKNNRFGRKTEKLDDIDGQLSLFGDFNEAEAATDESDTQEPEVEEVITVTRVKKKGKRDEDLAGFPEEPFTHDIPKTELDRMFGEGGWKSLPDETYKRLRVEPAVYTVEVHTVKVYASLDGECVVRGNRPKDLLRNSILTESLAATIFNAKFSNGLPVERISKEYERNNINISKQVMCNWIIQCSNRYLRRLYDRMRVKLMTSYHVVQADETVCYVTKDGRPANAESRMWVYRSGAKYKEHPIILFDYQKTRKAENLLEFTKDFNGILLSDAYVAYDVLARKNPNVISAFCWIHARRFFANALKALDKNSKESATETIAYKAIKKIANIYHVDNTLSELDSDTRRTKRQELVKPLVEDYFAWLEMLQASGAMHNGQTLKGINYSLNHKDGLMIFLEDGDVPLDNNATESALRPFCTHRKTWKLIDTISGAQASAVAYSIVETAKANKLNPFRYLEHILRVLADHKDDEDDSFLDSILPWSEELPESCKTKTILKK